MIADGQMIASAIGAIVAEEWQRTTIVRPNVELDAWVLMPNHLHGILIIKETQATTQIDTETRNTTAPDDPLDRGTLKPGSLGAIIGQIKSVSKKRNRGAGFSQFDWQPRFHDHIIRDDRSLANIREYVVNNPAQWALDELNPVHS